MKRAIALTLSTFFLAGTAYAADLPTYEAAPAPVAPAAAFDWTGFYLGLQGGFGGDEFTYPLDYSVGGTGVFNAEADLDSSGFFGGAYAGFNYQFGPNFVAGIEADINWADIEGKLDVSGNSPLLGGLNVTAKAGSQVNWFGTGRLKLGFLPTERFMIFATGGLAFGEVESSYRVTAAAGGGSVAFRDSTSDTEFGWTLGAGFEYAITDALSVKTDYAYVDLGDQTLYNAPLGLVAGDNLNIEAETSFHTIKAGLSYRF
ncbi:outer membrane protein [Afifella pfennigii]|uniref:outer membrane protein n=1 Tax=Afifella pfennigii TaxID=209897 RepID=UPI00054CD76C|nr:outer membrane beta-barrel protein [Afifella pfennigii]